MTVDEAIRVFGLGRKFTQDEVKVLYRKLAHKYHPDIAGAEFNSKFAEINEAYDVLSKLGDRKGCILTHNTIFTVTRNV